MNKYCNIFQIFGQLESGNQSRQTSKHYYTRQTEEHIRRSVATCEEGVAGRQSQVFKKKTCLQVVNFESAFDVFKVFIITDMGDMSVDNLMPLKVIVESTTLAARLSNRLLMALARWAAAEAIIGCEL